MYRRVIYSDTPIAFKEVYSDQFFWKFKSKNVAGKDAKANIRELYLIAKHPIQDISGLIYQLIKDMNYLFYL